MEKMSAAGLLTKLGISQAQNKKRIFDNIMEDYGDGEYNQIKKVFNDHFNKNYKPKPNQKEIVEKAKFELDSSKPETQSQISDISIMSRKKAKKQSVPAK